ncbi:MULTISPECIES: DUF134 domain-containing protein [unclassified Saccharicrinis]|uniref:DUF134 domain-containing protein n=1 Tax=unclassified Saccharicrinis TaxID=2646859 RepID=UPI003D34A4EF
MPRTKGCRNIGQFPNVYIFKPAGIRACELQEVVVELDEYEAIRLADEQGLYHAEAADEMGVSRQTFGRILEKARKKVATALINGYVLRIEKAAGNEFSGTKNTVEVNIETK